MTERRADARWPEERVWARHGRRTGSALIIGAGAVGGFLAEELARIGFSPLLLVDPDTLAVENLVRHPLGAQAVGQPKATGLAEKIRRDFPPCHATGLQRDFLEMSEAEQRALLLSADVVVAATDSIACQRHVNRVALAVGAPAVYPAVWVDHRIRDAEVGEILWVLPGGRTPCYECAAAFRQSASDAQAARGARVDIQLVVLATAQIVSALAHPEDERSVSLDPDSNAVYLHGLAPTSPAVRDAFPTSGLSSRTVRVSFPAQPCPACHGQRHTLSPGALRALEAGLPYDGEPEAERPPLTVFAVIALIVVAFFVASIIHTAHG
ncbi:HesA/MoeB/ThiF family protein [Streptomyces sp. NPDC020917]|uniref:HesA/MoeB/ThiF family protein n=1 Tax=Streptomyces sp. NPDC020917 TaxID=3365102 RepID=UPI0037AFC662